MVRLRLAALAAAAGLLTASAAPAPTICENRTGSHDGFFYTFWKDAGDACMTLGAKGGYAVRYRLGDRQNLVVGKGWRTGKANRTVGYRADRFEAGVNSYLTLYGWSVDPLIEYYVVDGWGSGFTPPGRDAKVLGTLQSDGGVYRIYRTQRVEKPSIRGTQTFYQYWSVRTEPRATGSDQRITFANHVRRWRELGMPLGTMDYQVMATEGFGSTGESSIRVWQD